VIVAAAITLNVPVLAPDLIATPVGTVRFGLLLLMETTLQPTDACASVAVQLPADPPVKLLGVQFTETRGPMRLKVTLLELLPMAPVTVADWLFGIAAVVALKAADVPLAGTVTDAGTVSVALVFVSATTAPPVGAACVSVTVHVLDAFCPRLVGLHTSDDTSTGATRLTVAFAELLLYVAVTVAL
jgi:hypothetical protein